MGVAFGCSDFLRVIDGSGVENYARQRGLKVERDWDERSVPYSDVIIRKHLLLKGRKPAGFVVTFSNSFTGYLQGSTWAIRCAAPDVIKALKEVTF